MLITTKKDILMSLDNDLVIDRVAEKSKLLKKIILPQHWASKMPQIIAGIVWDSHHCIVHWETFEECVVYFSVSIQVNCIITASLHCDLS